MATRLVWNISITDAGKVGLAKALSNRPSMKKAANALSMAAFLTELLMKLFAYTNSIYRRVLLAHFRQ